MREQLRHLMRALRYFRPDAGRIALAFALLLLATAANLLKPWPIAWTVDYLIEGKPWPEWLHPLVEGHDKPTLTVIMAGAVLLIHAAQAALSSGQTFLLIQTGLRGLARVRNELFQWLQRLSWRYHHEAQQGDLIYRASWDVSAFHTLFQQGLFTFISASLSLVLMFGVLCRVNAPLSLAILCTVPLLIAVIRILGREMGRRSLAAHQADSRLASLVQQGIAALPLIQSFGMEEAMAKRYAAGNQEAVNRRSRQHGFELAYLACVALIFALGMAAVVWLGATQVLGGFLSVGGLLVFLAYLGQFYEPLNQLSHMGATMADAFAGTHRVFEILDAPEEVKESPKARPLVKASASVSTLVDPQAPLPIKGAFRMEQVSFAYQKGRPVLSEVTFELSPGESVALIGPSGAGKSTLLHLLPRFFDPHAGTITLDGTDLREMKLRDLRRQIALVMQEPILLPGTVADNIACGLATATRAEIEAAAKASHAHEFILNLPNGYDTLIGEGAARLSTGEKQRLNLARAFLKDAPILVLDEPTSGLDAANEALVMDSLRTLQRGRTTLMVTHQIATIQQVDKILVLENGRLMASGTPSELRARNDYYARAAKR